ncbi:hypothetical protein VTI28DRAFT_7147 [Corynascus sepedonium]
METARGTLPASPGGLWRYLRCAAVSNRPLESAEAPDPACIDGMSPVCSGLRLVASRMSLWSGLPGPTAKTWHRTHFEVGRGQFHLVLSDPVPTIPTIAPTRRPFLVEEWLPSLEAFRSLSSSFQHGSYCSTERHALVWSSQPGAPVSEAMFPRLLHASFCCLRGASTHTHSGACT